MGFGNVWEANSTPMSRMAYSQSNKNKQKQYKSGHVRRETRLKLAMGRMASMKDVDISALSAEAINDAKAKRSPRGTGTEALSPKSKTKKKGSALFTKYKNKKRTFTDPKNTPNTMEF